MKKFYYLVAGILSMGMLASCSNEENIVAENNGNQQANAYLTLTLVGADNGASRTQPGEDGTAEGEPGESQITSAMVLLCAQDGTISQAVPTSNLTSTVAGVQTQPIAVTEGTYYVYVIANPGTYAPATGTKVTDVVMDNINATAMNGYSTDGKFIMFSECNGTDATAGAAITVTEANDYDHPATTEEPIKLDRLAAKITYDEVETVDISGAENQLGALEGITFNGFKLVNGIKKVNLQQHWSATTPATSQTAKVNTLLTPTATIGTDFYNQWSDYSTITTETAGEGGEVYTEVTDKVKDAEWSDAPLFCMENNSGSNAEDCFAAGADMQGNTTGVLFRATATLTADASDEIAGANCFYGYANTGDYFASLAALQDEYPSAFDDGDDSTDGDTELAAAEAELRAAVAGTAEEDAEVQTVSDFRVKYLVRVYENGVMYYTHYIEDQNYTAANDEDAQVLYHAVMRNTIYGLTVQSVKNIGDDVPGGWNPDVDPEEPIDVPNYLQVECKVNPWVLSNYNVTLQ